MNTQKRHTKFFAMLSIEKKEYFKRLLSQRLDDLLTEANKTSSGMTDFRDHCPDLLEQASIESDISFGFRIKGRKSILIRKIKERQLLLIWTFTIGLTNRLETDKRLLQVVSGVLRSSCQVMAMPLMDC